MKFSDVQTYVIGLLNGSFANKSTLDKLSTSNGVLFFDGTEIGSGSGSFSIICVDEMPILSDDKTTINYVVDGETLTTTDLDTWFFFKKDSIRYLMTYKDGQEFLIDEYTILSDQEIEDAIEKDLGVTGDISLNPVVPKIVNGEWYIGDKPTGVYATTKIANIGRDDNDHLVISVADGETGTDYDCGEIIGKNIYNGTVYADKLTVNGYKDYYESEQVIGCWINKKPIYRKFIAIEGSYSDNSSTEFDLLSLNIDELLNIKGSFYNKGNLNKFTFPYLKLPDQQMIAYYQESIKTLFLVVNGFPIINTNIYVEYTKTTDSENSFTPEMLQGITITSGGESAEIFTPEELEQMAEDDKF